MNCLKQVKLPAERSVPLHSRQRVQLKGCMRNSVLQKGSLANCCGAWYKSSGQESEVKLALNTFYCRWPPLKHWKRSLAFRAQHESSECTHSQLSHRLGSHVQGVSSLPWQAGLWVPLWCSYSHPRREWAHNYHQCWHSRGSALLRDVGHTLQGPGTPALEGC